MTLRQLMLALREQHPGLYSIERVGDPQQVSKSEIVRWIKNGSVEVNGEIERDPELELDFPVMKIVVHPRSEGVDKNGKKKVQRNTLLYRYGKPNYAAAYFV